MMTGLCVIGIILAIVLIVAYLLYKNRMYIFTIIGGGNPYTTGPTVPLHDKTQNNFEEIDKVEREKNIAAIKRRFGNHEEILSFINELPEEDKDVELEFLVSLTKKERDRFNWEAYKSKLNATKEAYLKENDGR